MNPRFLDPANLRNPSRRWTLPPGGPAAAGAGDTNSRRERWIRALLAALNPAPRLGRFFRVPPEPAEARPADAPTAPVDARERSPWSPFSPRF